MGPLEYVTVQKTSTAAGTSRTTRGSVTNLNTSATAGNRAKKTRTSSVVAGASGLYNSRRTSRADGSTSEIPERRLRNVTTMETYEIDFETTSTMYEPRLLRSNIISTPQRIESVVEECSLESALQEMQGKVLGIQSACNVLVNGKNKLRYPLNICPPNIPPIKRHKIYEQTEDEACLSTFEDETIVPPIKRNNMYQLNENEACSSTFEYETIIPPIKRNNMYEHTENEACSSKFEDENGLFTLENKNDSGNLRGVLDEVEKILQPRSPYAMNYYGARI